jgi:hypothetical protein
MPTPIETHTRPEDVIRLFVFFVLSPSRTRLDIRLYGHTWAEAREAYLGDRNKIRRDTYAFHKIWDKIKWRNKPDLAAALIIAGRSAFSGRLCWDAEIGKWEYTTGQYTPTEIRRAAYQVAISADRILNPEQTK